MPTRVNKTEATFEKPRVNVKFERSSTFTFTRDRAYIAFILFTFVGTEKLPDREIHLKARKSFIPGNLRLGFPG